MSGSRLCHQFMTFDTAIHSHLNVPLTLEEALNDSSLENRLLGYRGNSWQTRQSEKYFSIPAMPPSTQKSSFELVDYTNHGKARDGSISSDRSVPSMVEDNPGLSDSDADPFTDHDPYEESMARLWDTYETLLVQNEASEAIMLHLSNCPDELRKLLPPSPSEVTLPLKYSPAPNPVNSRLLKRIPTDQCTFTPTPTYPHSRAKSSHRQRGEAHGAKFLPLQDAAPVVTASRLHRSDAQYSAHPAPDTLKPLPPPPLHERARSSLHSSTSKGVGSQLSARQPHHRRHPSYALYPYSSRPNTNHCNSGFEYSFHNTPPLPFQSPVEKSVFDYDTDDGLLDSATHLSSSLAKLHICSFSLGKKIGTNGNNSMASRNGRRRSATEIMRGVFGIGKK